jgi:hypothetical protein
VRRARVHRVGDPAVRQSRWLQYVTAKGASAALDPPFGVCRRGGEGDAGVPNGVFWTMSSQLRCWLSRDGSVFVKPSRAPSGYGPLRAACQYSRASYGCSVRGTVVVMRLTTMDEFPQRRLTVVGHGLGAVLGPAWAVRDSSREVEQALAEEQVELLDLVALVQPVERSRPSLVEWGQRGGGGAEVALGEPGQGG